MSLIINESLKNNKAKLLEYFRSRAKECCVDVESIYGSSQYKKRTSEINSRIKAVAEQLRSHVLQIAQKNSWDNKTILETLLMIQYAESLSALECRNNFWSYDYMSFSRRMGELWEKYCYLCFEYPCNAIQLFTPPLFDDLKQFLTSEFEEYINKLPISEIQKIELLKYYAKVWKIVVSGDINLQLDCHFTDGEFKYNIDFKSGFGSNEKGNTNRLLLVGTLYSFFQKNYRCILLVRSEEDDNNHYFRTLKQSIIWEAYCAQEAYMKIYEYTGFNLASWFHENVHWQNDLSPEFVHHICSQNLMKYIQW